MDALEFRVYSVQSFRQISVSVLLPHCIEPFATIVQLDAHTWL